MTMRIDVICDKVILCLYIYTKIFDTCKRYLKKRALITIFLQFKLQLEFKLTVDIGRALGFAQQCGILHVALG